MISKQAEGKKLYKDALQVASEAKISKAKNKDTIDATIGSLQDEQGLFYRFETIDRIIRHLPDHEFYTYSASDGGKPFHDAVLKWVFDKQLATIMQSMHCRIVATPGGTGAISNAIYNSCDPNEYLLYPNMYWGPYANMAKSNQLQPLTFKLLDDNCFNYQGFVEKCLMIGEKQGHVTFILNDPCNNPSGYSLTNAELQSIITFMNDHPQYHFTMIYDIAYLDYGIQGFAKTREKLALIKNANENVLISIAFSGSKTFAIYGLRLGAQIILSKDAKSVQEWYDSSNFLARTRWSNTCKAGISLVIKIASDEQLFINMQNELKQAVALINQRAKQFIAEANQENLDLYPYGGGFFITIRCLNPETIADYLKEQAIFVLTFDESIRISIGALRSEEIKGLARKIKQTIIKINI